MVVQVWCVRELRGVVEVLCGGIWNVVASKVRLLSLSDNTQLAFSSQGFGRRLL